MLKRDINFNEHYVTQETGRYTIHGDIEDGAVVDCRHCILTIEGNRGDNVTIHSLGKPTITGNKGSNVTYFIYDSSGRCRVQKIGHEGDLVVGSGESVSISTSMYSFNARRANIVASALSQPISRVNNSSSVSITAVGGTVFVEPGADARIQQGSDTRVSDQSMFSRSSASQPKSSEEENSSSDNYATM